MENPLFTTEACNAADAERNKNTQEYRGHGGNSLLTTNIYSATKACIKCGVEKPLHGFGPRKISRDGHRNECRICLNAMSAKWAASNRHLVNQYKQKCTQKNPEKYKAAFQRRNSAVQNDPVRREKRNKQAKTFYEQNREWWLLYYEENKAHQLAGNRVWRKNNPEKARAKVSRRRARTLEALPEWLTPEQHREIEMVYKQAASLSVETGIPHQVDHIIPLRGKTVSGLHVPWNLQAIPAKENMSKHNKLLEAK